jgi:hypothetical protein
MNIRKLALASTAIVAIGLAGCATDYVDMTQPEKVAATVDKMPDWMEKLPEKKDSVFSAGTAVSTDLQMSLDKSILFAKRTLADRIGGELSTQTKHFVTEVGEQGSDAILIEMEMATRNVVAQINVAGYNPVENKIVPTGKYFRTYVLLEYQMGEANRLLVNEIKKNRALYARIRSSVAFRELDNQVDSKNGRDDRRTTAEINAIKAQ